MDGFSEQLWIFEMRSHGMIVTVPSYNVDVLAESNSQYGLN